jgi:hypothetical protein
VGSAIETIQRFGHTLLSQEAPNEITHHNDDQIDVDAGGQAVDAFEGHLEASWVDDRETKSSSAVINRK